MQYAGEAFRRIEADAIGEPAVAVGIIGDHDGDAPLADRRAPQFHPARGEGGCGCGAVRQRLIPRRRKSCVRFVLALLEGDGMGEDASVDFRQHHMHGEIARGQPARRALPFGARGARQRHLQDRAVVSRQHPGVVIGGGGGEGGGVDDDVGRMSAQRRAQERRGALVLEAGDVNRHRTEPLGVERLAKCCDRRGVGAHDQCAIEDHRGAGARTAARLARPEAGRRHRPGRRRQLGAADQMRRVA